MNLGYNCDKCGKELSFSPVGNPKDKIGKNGKYTICKECVDKDKD